MALPLAGASMPLLRQPQSVHTGARCCFLSKPRVQIRQQYMQSFRLMNTPCCVRRRNSPPRAAAVHPELADYSSLPSFLVDEPEVGGNPFKYSMEMDSQQKMLSGIPGALFYPLIVAAVAVAAGLAAIGVRGLPVWNKNERDIAAVSSGAVVGAAGAVIAWNLKKKRDSAAYVELYQTLSRMDNPTQLSADDMSGISSKYMIQWSSQTDNLKTIYNIFLESIIPQGEQTLKGDEAEKVTNFKNALGLDDNEAAAVHIDVGRRLFSRSFEAKDKAAAFEQRKAFQRLIYVSILVFGETRAAFLLPWQRTFTLNPQQVYVARRDNAKEVFKAFVAEHGDHIPADRVLLQQLRERQNKYLTENDSAEEVIGSCVRTHVENLVEKALDCIKNKSRTKNYTVAIEAIHELLDYRTRMLAYAAEEDMVPGLGQLTIKGGRLDVDNRRRDLLDMFRIYMEDSIAKENAFTDKLESELKELKVVVGLSDKDANNTIADVSADLYKRLLRDEVKSKRLDAAASPAQVLGTLCMKTRFSPQQAADLHKGLYKQKFNQLLEKKSITEEDENELRRIQRILCIPNQDVFLLKKQTAGKVLRQAVDDVFQLGAKPIGEFEAEKIDKLVKELRLDPDVAIEVLSEAARLRFKSYAITCKKTRNKKDGAATLKQMIQFNVFVVTPILEKLKGYDAAKKELADLLAKAAEAAQKEGGEVPGVTPAEPPAAPAVGPKSATDRYMAMTKQNVEEDTEKRGQKDINLAKDMDFAERSQLYKDYLIASMSGDVMELPVGGMMRKKANTASNRAESWRLQELSNILGMGQMEISQVNGELAEQAYRAQATEAVRASNGNLTPQRKVELASMAAQLGIQQKQADKVLSEVKQQVLGISAAAAEGEGFTMVKLLELHNSGINLEKAAPEAVRKNMYRKEVEKRVVDGTGSIDSKYVLEDLPKILCLDDSFKKRAIKEVVATRKRMLLVQSISQLRQKRAADATTSMANLLNCWRIMPDEKAMQWAERAELQDLYVCFCEKFSDESKQKELVSILGLSQEELDEVRHKVRDAQAIKTADEEDGFF